MKHKPSTVVGQVQGGHTDGMSSECKGFGTVWDGLSRARWRRGWDSNPRYARAHAGFQDRCLKPLGHLSRSHRP